MTIEGLGSIDRDFEEFRKTLNAQLNAAVESLEAPLKDDLKHHVETDVYQAYPNPKEYPRRRDNPEFGTPLIDMGDINTYFGKLGREPGIIFRYTPTGSHSGTTKDLDPYSKYYNADNPRPLKPEPVHGDDLIRRIETGRGYDWDVYPGKRPFWTNFVDEELEGLLAQHFETGMRIAGVTDLVIGWDDVKRESGDGEY